MLQERSTRFTLHWPFKDHAWHLTRYFVSLPSQVGVSLPLAAQQAEPTLLIDTPADDEKHASAPSGAVKQQSAKGGKPKVCSRPTAVKKDAAVTADCSRLASHTDLYLQMTLQDALLALIPVKFHKDATIERLVSIVRAAKTAHDAAGKGASPSASGISLRQVHELVQKPMMQCNMLLSALTAARFLERHADTGRKGAGIVYTWLPSRARAALLRQ